MKRDFLVIVAGGRDFQDYNLMKEKLDELFLNVRKRRNIVIVSGKARGADSLGERYARENDFKVIEFPADWKQYGNGAGPRRNVEMAKVSHALVAFHDGSSRGTAHMIATATKMNLKVRVIHY